MGSLIRDKTDEPGHSQNLDEAFSAVEILNKTIHENASLRRQLSNLEAENQDLKKRLQEGREALGLLASCVFGEQHEFHESRDRIRGDYSYDDEARVFGEEYLAPRLSDRILFSKEINSDGWMDTDSGSALSLTSSHVDALHHQSRSTPAINVSNRIPQARTNAGPMKVTEEFLVISPTVSGNSITSSEQPQPLGDNKDEEATHPLPHTPIKSTKKKGFGATTLQRRLYDKQVAWQTAEDNLWKNGIQEEPTEVKSSATPRIAFGGDKGIHGIYLKGLPRDLDLESLCRSISGGRIHRIFLNTTGPHKNVEALVAFVKPAAAHNFYQSIEAEGFQIAGHKLRASDVLSEQRSDYWVSPGIQTEIMEYGWTRCLILSSLPRNLTASVVRRHIEEKVLWMPERKQTPLIESIIWDENKKIIRLNMAGIYLAQNVKSSLKKRKEYSRVIFTYARDPCDTDDARLVTSDCSSKPLTPDMMPPGEFSSRNPLNDTVSSLMAVQPAMVSPLRIYRNALLSIANPNPRCRKVVFSRLPRSTTLSSLAQNIRGGIVEGIYFYTDRPTAYPEAVVIFRDTKAAWCCYIYFKTINPIISGGKVTLVPFNEIRPDPRPKAASLTEPTPLTARRSVRLYGLPRFATQERLEADIKAALSVMLRHNYMGRPSQLLESLALDPYRRGADIIFSQIKVARNVIKRLRTGQRYSRCTFNYLKDPCEGNVEELLSEGECVEGLDNRQYDLRTPETVPDAGVNAKVGRVGLKTDANPRGGPPPPLHRVKPKKVVRFALDFENP